MATYHAIAATSHAILRVLKEACPRSVFPSAQFEFLPLAEDAKPLSEGLSLHLYRVAGSTSRRHSPARPVPAVENLKYRPLLNLDLFYLLSPWASNADTQHRLLGWAMRTLDDTPILVPGLLNAFGVEAETFHSHEAVELILDSLSLQDMSMIWDQIRPKPGLSAGYVARMVPLESTVAIAAGAEVQTRQFDLAKLPQP